MLENLNVEYAAEQVRPNDGVESPVFSEIYGGLTFSITAHPKPVDHRGAADIPSLGAVLPDVLLECKANEDIQQAVIRKTRHYGELKLPYIVAINVLNEDNVVDFDDMLDGLFGQRIVEVGRGPQGALQRRIGRATDGAWRSKKGPINSVVSGALIVGNLLPTTIGVETPLLLHNPWAKNPLATPLWRLPQKSLDMAKGEFVSHPGLQASQLLGFQEGWFVLD